MVGIRGYPFSDSTVSVPTSSLLGSSRQTEYTTSPNEARRVGWGGELVLNFDGLHRSRVSLEELTASHIPWARNEEKFSVVTVFVAHACDENSPLTVSAPSALRYKALFKLQAPRCVRLQIRLENDRNGHFFHLHPSFCFRGTQDIYGTALDHHQYQPRRILRGGRAAIISLCKQTTVRHRPPANDAAHRVHAHAHKLFLMPSPPYNKLPLACPIYDPVWFLHPQKGSEQDAGACSAPSRIVRERSNHRDWKFGIDEVCVRSARSTDVLSGTWDLA